MQRIIRSTRDFAEIADLIAAETAQPTNAFAAAFESDLDGVRIAYDGAELIADMPDALQVQLATELVITTLFDVLRDSRIEHLAERIAWGFVNSLHMTARTVEGQADGAARAIKELVRDADGSEVMMHELEEAQDRCQRLDEEQDAIACMRDHAAAAFHVETGKPWSTARGSLVSSKRTASVIAATDFLSARRSRRVDQFDPQAPLVAFSGGTRFENHAQVRAELDRAKALIPNMVLLTTDLEIGADAIAKSWAAANNVKVVREELPKGMGKSAAFVRNDRMLAKRPVHAIVCEGSGIQLHFIRILDGAGIAPALISNDGGRPIWARDARQNPRRR